MKKRIPLGLCLILFLFMGIASSCTFNKVKTVINLDLQDGSKVLSQIKWVNSGEETFFDKPDDPKKTGYRFDGWFYEPDFINEFNYDTDKLQSGQTITLYAKFTLIAITNPPPYQNSLMVPNFYTLQFAYDNGFVTQDDIRHISYFYRGEVWENVWQGGCIVTEDRIDFQPTRQKESVDELDEKVISDINDTYYAFAKDYLEDKNSIVINDSFGEYNGFYAIRISSSEWEYPDVERFDTIEYKSVGQEYRSISWGISGPPIVVFGYRLNVPFFVEDIKNSSQSSDESDKLVIISSVFDIIENDFSANTLAMLVEYTQEFFEENSLIVYVLNSSTMGGSLDILSIVQGDNTLIMNLDFVQGDADALSTWTVIIKVKDSDMVGANVVVNCFINA